MAIDWKHFEELEGWVKRTQYFRNEPIERMTIFLNLFSPVSHPKILEEKIRKIDAFNEYLAFKEIREICRQEGFKLIKSPYEVPHEILNSFKDLIVKPELMKWDITPYFTALAENKTCKLIVYENNKYGRIIGGDKFATDLMHGLQRCGIMEFCPDKKYLFERNTRIEGDKFI